MTELNLSVQFLTLSHPKMCSVAIVVKNVTRTCYEYTAAWCRWEHAARWVPKD